LAGEYSSVKHATEKRLGKRKKEKQNRIPEGEEYHVGQGPKRDPAE